MLRRLRHFSTQTLTLNPSQNHLSTNKMPNPPFITPNPDHVLIPNPPPPLSPTLKDLTTHLHLHFPNPAHPSEVPWAYHTPRPPLPPFLPTAKLTLSITPTPGVYESLNRNNPSRLTRVRPAQVLFLHRPWSLDRKRIPRGTVVLASHKGFDEVLTVGWNVGLAGRLGVRVGDGGEGGEGAVGIGGSGDVMDAGAGGVVGAVGSSKGENGGDGVGVGERAVCIKGYKGDADRRIGLVGLVEGGRDVRAEEILERVRREFVGVVEGSFGFEDERGSSGDESDGGVPLSDGIEPGANKPSEGRIQVVAIMNAFHPEEVERVAAAANQLQGRCPPADAAPSADCGNVLYLTGAVREAGLQTARAKGMKVICVGHRACEEWGVRYTAEFARREFPLLEVEEILEEEEPRPKKVKVVQPAVVEGEA